MTDTRIYLTVSLSFGITRPALLFTYRDMRTYFIELWSLYGNWVNGNIRDVGTSVFYQEILAINTLYDTILLQIKDILQYNLPCTACWESQV